MCGSPMLWTQRSGDWLTVPLESGTFHNRTGLWQWDRIARARLCGSKGSQAILCVMAIPARMRAVRVVLVQRVVVLMCVPRSRVCRTTLMVVLGTGQTCFFINRRSFEEEAKMRDLSGGHKSP